MSIVLRALEPFASMNAVTYTNLHLSAISFVHPPSIPNIKQCACETVTVPKQEHDQSNLIRVYYTEPSTFGYNQGSYLVKESRYNTTKGWHTASDDLVADDAAAGSPVSAIGWWVEGGNSVEEVWEVCIYTYWHIVMQR